MHAVDCWAWWDGGFWTRPTNNESHPSWVKEVGCWAVNGRAMMEREKSPLLLCLWFSPALTQYRFFTLEEGCDKVLLAGLWPSIPCKCVAARQWVLSLRICGTQYLDFSHHAVCRGAFAGSMTSVGIGEVAVRMNLTDWQMFGLFPGNVHIRRGFACPCHLIAGGFFSSSIVLLYQMPSYAHVRLPVARLARTYDHLYVAIKGIRDKVQLATKFGLENVDGKVEIQGDPAYVRACCKASLKRLNVEYIDL